MGMRVLRRSAFVLAFLVAPGTALGTDKSIKDEKWCREALSKPFEDLDPGRRIALSLSGGGYRAMLYHIGTLRRLNEAGLLAEIAVVSSVSGGSITAGMLAKAWDELEFGTRVLDAGGPERAERIEVSVAVNFEQKIAQPLMRLAGMTIDIPAVISGFFPFGSAADVVANRYDEFLFGKIRIADLKEPEGRATEPARPRRPVFIFNATSLQTGELWQFRARAMGGPAVGWTHPGDTRLAQAVAASSAFPPFLSPLYLRPATVEPEEWHDCRQVEYGHANDPRFHTRRTIPDDEFARYREEIFLTDGGVRDNLGMVAIEQINRRRIRGEKRALDELISDSGRAFGFHPDPFANWLSQGLRVMSITSSEPDALRIDALIDRSISYTEDNEAHCDLYRREKRRLKEEQGGEPSFRLKALCFGGDGAYWSVQREAPRHRYYEEPPARWIHRDDVGDLGKIATRLEELDETTRERLVNWGYLSAHYGLGFLNRLWECRQVRRLGACALPHPAAGLGERTGKATNFCLRPVKCDPAEPAASRQ